MESGLNTGVQAHKSEIRFVAQAFAGAGGRFAGIFAPPLRADRRGYRLGAGCANLPANRLAIIPRSGEISGLVSRHRIIGACSKPVNPLFESYGQIIVDECHHLSAFSFAEILKRAKVKYVLGCGIGASVATKRWDM